MLKVRSVIMVKKFLTIFSLVICMFCLVACDEGNDDGPHEQLHDSKQWFTEKELEAKGLKGLKAPINLTGDMNSSDVWFNDGYSFSQNCPSEEVFEENAKIIFEYLKANYNGKMGKPRIEKMRMETNETWYIIEQKETLADYFDDNPSKLYLFYYVVDETLEDGYLTSNGVLTLEIRYEFDTSTNAYLFKLFIENPSKSHNGAYTNYYKLRG